MEKKIGLCIVYKNCNYGSILQSYATILKIGLMNYDCEIIRYNPVKDFSFYMKSIPRLANIDMVYGKILNLKRKTGKIQNPEYKKNDEIRNQKFLQFVQDKFGNFSDEIQTYEDLCTYAGTFSDVMVGSDQLWLPSGLGKNFYNLMFVPEKTNKIAYAASFGVSEIPFYQKERTCEYLKRIEHISVREHSGQKIIKDLTGRDVPVLPDPTMVIEPGVWNSEVEDRTIVDGDYIFCYFLGNNKKHRDEVNKLSHETGKKIVFLRHLDEYIPDDEKFGDIAPYDIGPEEFINLIRHARYICTDSFHGSVFSTIFHKQFLTFPRYKEGKNSRNSRIDTLFQNIGISRYFTDNVLAEINKEIDWDFVDNNLQKHRNIADEFLTKSLA